MMTPRVVCGMKVAEAAAMATPLASSGSVRCEALLMGQAQWSGMSCGDL